MVGRFFCIFDGTILGDERGNYRELMSKNSRATWSLTKEKIVTQRQREIKREREGEKMGGGGHKTPLRHNLLGCDVKWK